MIQGWNKACFRGGLMEARIKLPGNSFHSGLWPAFWALGNLGRAGYTATTEGEWVCVRAVGALGGIRL